MMGSPPRTAWPDELLLDELSLRARREVVQALDSASLWPAQSRASLISGDQRARGKSFIDREMRDWLGPGDFRWIHSESVFGRSNHRLRARLPMLVGYGHELGGGLHSWLGCPLSTRGAAMSLGATFNLGIVLFDLVCDGVPAGASRIASALDGPLLRSLFVDPEAGSALLARQEVADAPELRILFKAVVRFFELVRANVTTREHLSPLADALELAFRAQLDTANPQTCSVAAVESKSVLPFTIMLRSIRACCKPETLVAGDHAEDIVRIMGRVFWLVDDLADLCKDLGAGAVNGVLMRVAAPGSAAGATARRLLKSQTLADAASEVRDQLAKLIKAIAPSRARMDGGWPFEEWLLVSVRGWIAPSS